VVDGKIIVELKAVVVLPPVFEAYLLSYLRASKLRVGYLVNFGAAKLQVKRRVM
jgi:GxxExxY protein